MVSARRYLFLLLALTALLGASGCAPPIVSATSTIHADGSFHRSLTYQADFEGPPSDSPLCAPTVEGSDLAGQVSPPRADDGWVLTARQDKKGHRLITAGRNVVIGEPLTGDLGVLQPAVPGKTPAPQFANRVTVHRIDAHRLEYREVIRWRGPLPDLLASPVPWIRRDILQRLPKPAPGDSRAIDRVTVALQRVICEQFANLNDIDDTPNQSNQSDADRKRAEAEQKIRMRQALHKEISSVAFNALPLPPADPAVTIRIADLVAAEDPLDQPSKSNDKSNTADVIPMHLQFTAKMPGKILSTNGRRSKTNPSREVAWNISSYAPAFGDVTLTAVCGTAER